MNFVSILFLCLFLPITLIIYYSFYKHAIIQNAVLVVANFIFYISYGVFPVIYLLISIGVTYFAGLLMNKYHSKKKIIFIISLILNLSSLLICKYLGFLLGNVNILLNVFKISLPVPKILLPVGLSFFVFQSCTYLFDIYNEKTQVERNFINFTAFVSFFPTIVSGPIQKSKDFLPLLRRERKLNFYSTQKAVLLFLWGCFLKIVISNRLAIFTNEVFLNYVSYGTFELLFCAIGYAIQIYTDFAGYSLMAISVAILFGFELKDNFRQPYFARTIPDFWKRWHISLTSWLTEYIFIPLGGSRNGKLKNYVNILIVFLISGIWHGAGWNFIIWGALHAVYQVVGKVSLEWRIKVCNNLKINRESAVFKIYQHITVFVLVTFAWIFFRLTNVADAFGYISHMFTNFNPWVLVSNLYSIGITKSDFNILICAFITLFIVSKYKEKGKDISSIVESNCIIKSLITIVLVFTILIFGTWGPGFDAGSFIYAGF